MSVAVIEKTVTEVGPETVAEIDAIGDKVIKNYSLADALREGSGLVSQVRAAWGDGIETGCALTAAKVAAKARGII